MLLPSLAALFLFITSSECLSTNPIPSASGLTKEVIKQTSDYVISTKDGHSKIFTFPIEDIDEQKHATTTWRRLKGTHPQTSVKDNFFRASNRVKRKIITTFVPSSGYPALTPSGYIRFSIYSAIQDLSTSLRSVLATQRVLEGIGVGRAGASALSASLNFIVRDGVGMVRTQFEYKFSS